MHLLALGRMQVHLPRVPPTGRAVLTHCVTHLTIGLWKSTLPECRTLLHGRRDASGPTMLPRTLTHATILDAHKTIR